MSEGKGKIYYETRLVLIDINGMQETLYIGIIGLGDINIIVGAN
jgi:hypothetical protein